MLIFHEYLSVTNVSLLQKNYCSFCRIINIQYVVLVIDWMFSNP